MSNEVRRRSSQNKTRANRSQIKVKNSQVDDSLQDYQLRSRSRQKRKKQKKKSSIFDKFLTILIIILTFALAVVVVSQLTTQNATVVGQSMENTLHNNDHLLIDTFTMKFQPLERKDIVVLHEDNVGEDNLIVKRIIGIAGDKISFTTDGKPIVNGEELKEDYIKEQKSNFTADFKVVIEKTNAKYHTNFDVNSNVIPEGYYFVMGDNRNNSSDSRAFGLFAKSDIIGRVAFDWTNRSFL